MKWKFFKSFFILAALILMIVACSEQEIGPLESNTIAPGQISNITVQNLPGKAKISYTLPNDQDLLYVKAAYTLENGKEMEVKSSYYNNSLLLEGFTGNTTKEVELYAVNRSEIASKPVNITVEPEEAPFWDVFRSLEVGPDFGGIKVEAENPNNDDLAILVMEKNDEGDWEPLPTSIYTSIGEISRSIRGMDTIRKEFAFTVRDRWLNVSDTLFAEIQPLYEMLMPKSDYAGPSVPGDAQVIGTYPKSNLWDGEFQAWWGSYFTERTIDIGPHMVTFDIGRKTKLSRIRIWDFPEPIGGQITYYYLGAMKHFRIWGSNDISSGDLNDWTLLGEYEVVKPSGLPYGQQTNEDYLEAEDGNDYEIPIEMPAFRYLRIESLENWTGGQFMAISEVHVYGNPDL